MKNEEENIPRLIKSVEGCFDEIIFTDTGSTDRSVEVARSLGASVNHFDWVNDFSAARNFNFSHAKTDYICWLDLDDVLEDAQSFIRFRDTAMNLADYWISAYHYTSDPNGKALCTFARERVIRRDRQMRWKYFVHEGVYPESPLGEVKIQYIPTWSVRHMRTDADLQKDRSRNLSLFEEHKKSGQLDARLKYYYGKELFEASKPIEAAQQLGEALTDTKLEMHDRLLAMQYACYTYIQCNQFDRAIDMAHAALQLSPQRAEYLNIIGDGYLKLGRFQDAVPYYGAAKNCVFHNQPGYAGAIFSNESMYSVYPSNQLSRIYANIGDFEKAKAEAIWCFQTFKDQEAKSILDEVNKLSSQVGDYTQAVPCADIVFSTAPQTAYEFDADTGKDKALGGSETALVEMAYHLHKQSGRPVKVFNMRQIDKVCDGVEYIDNKKLNAYMSANRPFLHIAWRHNIKVTDATTFLWCHDLTTPGAENSANYERLLALTQFHKNYAMTMQGIPDNKIHVTRNGIKPERFKDGPWEKDPFKFVFGSSPDRGLERCIRVLDKVREKYPQVTLDIFYGWDHFIKYNNPALNEMASRLEKMVGERKDWIKYYGSTQQDALMHAYKHASYVVQPSDWIETSCISAMEFLACGVYPIFRKVGGVADTLNAAACAGMATLVDSDCITERDYQRYVDATIAAIDEKAQERVKIDVDHFSWAKIAEEWLRDLPGIAGGHG